MNNTPDFLQKKVLKMEPVIGQTGNCYYAMVPTIAAYLMTEYILLASDTWGFEYDGYNGCLSQTLFAFRWKHVISRFASCINGLEVQICSPLSFEEALGVIVLAIHSNQPVSIHVDSFWCPWLSHYQKVHASHHLLVKGYDTSSNELICLELYVEEGTEHVLPFTFYQKGLNEIYCYSAVQPKSVVNAGNILHHCQSCNEGKLDRMRWFQEDIRTYYNPASERKTSPEIMSMPLIVKLDEISKLRLQYSKLVQYLQNNDSKDLEQLSVGMTDLSVLWGRLKLSFIKSQLYQSTTIHQELFDLMDRIIQKEAALSRIADSITS